MKVAILHDYQNVALEMADWASEYIDNNISIHHQSTIAAII